MLGDAGRAQRQRTAERAAQIIALGQLPRVELEQLTGSRQECHLQLLRPSHRTNLHGSAGRQRMLENGSLAPFSGTVRG